MDEAGDTTRVALVGTLAPPLDLDTAVELRAVVTQDGDMRALHVELIDTTSDQLLFAARTGWVSPIDGLRATVELEPAGGCTHLPEDEDDSRDESYSVRVTVGDAGVVVPQHETVALPETALVVEHQSTVYTSLYDGDFERWEHAVVVRRAAE